MAQREPVELPIRCPRCGNRGQAIGSENELPFGDLNLHINSLPPTFCARGPFGTDHVVVECKQCNEVFEFAPRKETP